MNAKRILFSIILSVLPVFAYSQRPDVRQEVLDNWILSCGQDALYDFDIPVPDPAPDGYEAFYVSHYGRHGSRFPYTASVYTSLLEMLQEAGGSYNLTPYGIQVLEELEPLWKKSEHKVGDLTRLGWEQQQEIARMMVKNFPSAFPSGSRIDACASPSTRSIMSMSSFCLALGQVNPSLDIYERQGVDEVQATRPNLGKNPFRLTGPDVVYPYGESRTDFFLRTFPEHKDVLARLFKDPEAALGQRSPLNTLGDIFMLVGGMNSLPEDYRMDLGGIFTKEEFAKMWECFNYVSFHEYWAYRTPCCSVYDDIIAKADARIENGETGADLRFGHDHVLLALMLIADIEGFGTLPQDIDHLAEHFQSFRSPMAANLQFVFYRPLNGEGEILFRLLLNGEKARIGNMTVKTGGCYSWNDFKTYFAAIRSTLVNAPATITYKP